METIPTKSHLFKWKISTDNLCNVCKVEEDYDHFFMSCKYLHMLWNKINDMLKKNQIWKQYQTSTFSIWIQHFWQRILSHKQLFTIYKSYYVSGKKTKKIDVYLLFKNEFQRNMKENKILGKNSLFKNILNKLW